MISIVIGGLLWSLVVEYNSCSFVIIKNSLKACHNIQTEEIVTTFNTINTSLLGLLNYSEQISKEKKNCTVLYPRVKNVDTILKSVFNWKNFHTEVVEPRKIQNLVHHKEHEFLYHESYIPSVQKLINKVNHAKVGVLTSTTCDNLFATRLAELFNLHRTKTFCEPLDLKTPESQKKSLAVIRYFTHINITHCLLALSPIDTIFILETHAFKMSVLTQFVIFGFKDYFFNIIKQEIYELHIINIMELEQENLDAVQWNVSSNLIDYIQNNTTKQSIDYLKFLEVARENIYKNITTVLRETSKNHSEKYQYAKREKRYINCSSTVYYPFIFILDNINPDKTGYCPSGRLCRTPLKEGGKTKEWISRCCHGLAIEVLDLIADDLNFDYDMTFAEDETFGGLVDGRWTGMVGDLVENRSEFVVQGLTPTNPRLEVVDFTPAYVFTHLGIVRKVNIRKLEVINWDFLLILEFWLMILIVISTIGSVFLVYFIENTHWLFTKGLYFPFRESMAYIFGLTFQRDMGGKNPTRWSGRILAIGYAIAMTIVMTTYTAHITAKNIKMVEDDGFTGLMDQRIKNPSSKFKFATMANTSSEMFFKNNPLEIYQNVWKHMILVPNDKVGVEKIYTEEIQAYFSDNIYVQGIIAEYKYCTKLSMYDEMRRQTSVAFAMRKHFDLGDKISSSLLKFREEGIIEDLVNKWIYVPNCSTYESESQRFPWFYFGGIVLFMAISLVASVFINLFENVYTFVKTKRTRLRTETETEIISNAGSCKEK